MTKQMAATHPAPALPPFQRLVDEHASVLGAYLGGMLRPADAEDALQETFLSALRAYERFDGADPRAWLLTIARRKAIDCARAERRRPSHLAEPDLLAAPVEDRAAGRTKIWEAVAGLPRKQREAVVLRFAADLRYREIGQAMGCSEAAARRSVHEAMKKLRKESETEEVVR